MTSASFEKTCLTLLAVLWLVPAGLSASSYEEISLPVPAGAEYGWTVLPDAPSSLGDAFLVVPSPRGAKDSLSGVWSLQENRRGGYELRRLAAFKDKIEAFPADIDGNGVQDIAVFFPEKQSVRIYFGLPVVSSLAYGPVYRDYELPSGTGHYFGAGDLDGDGLAEMLVTDKLEDGFPFLAILWAGLSADGEITYARLDTMLYPLPADVPFVLRNADFYFGDYNGDRLTDFVFVGTLFLNNGDRAFEPAGLSGFTGQLSLFLGAADLDRDGLTELITTRTVQVQREGTAIEEGEELVISGFTEEAGFCEELVLESRPVASSFRFGEFTGDKYPDLALYKPSLLSIYPGAADSTFLLQRETLIPGSIPYAREMLGPADWDQDGLLDWMFLIPGEKLIVMVQLAPLYTDKTAEVGLDTSMAGHAAAVADYNRDGYPDIYIVNGSGPNALYAGSADGNFRDMARQAGVAQANDGISCAWGDYDNDGLPDLLVSGMQLSDKLFHNNGDGTFSDSSRILNFSRSGERITSVCWGDVNNDGWLDLMFGNFKGPDILLLSQAGRYFRRSTSEVFTGQYKTESAVLVDVNLDGRLDVVSVNADGPTRLIINTPTGFSEQTATSGLNPDNQYKKLGQTQTWGDFNRDGYPDLYITRAQDVDMLFLNGGKLAGPRFIPAFSGHHLEKYGRLASAVADFDANGVPDLLIARSSRFGEFIANPRDLLFLGSISEPHPLSGEASVSATGSEVPPSVNMLGLDRYVNSSLPVCGDFDLDGDLDLLFVNYLPDNSLGLFQGKPLPLSYMQNQSQVNDNLLVKLRRINRQSTVGTRVVLHGGDKMYAQVVSGGFGRIQTGSLLLFSPGAEGADSLTVYWPQGRVTTRRGPFSPGILEITDDRRGPVISAVELPGLYPAQGPLFSDVDTFYALVQVKDDSPLEKVLAELISTSDTGLPPATVQGVETGVPGIFRFALPAPAPGDSLGYRIRAWDINRNVGYLPETSTRYFYLKVATNYIKGDINGDGRVNIMDLVRCAQIMKLIGAPPTQEELYRADLNQDGRVDEIDLKLLPTYF
ncbi:MAG: VCBS repeat-containing protein [Candidatus Glassbacteria bacterium]|nr:VCBS repeat-containing protein [Candidatus Glassbacteria bacterium]